MVTILHRAALISVIACPYVVFASGCGDCLRVRYSPGDGVPQLPCWTVTGSASVTNSDGTLRIATSSSSYQALRALTDFSFLDGRRGSATLRVLSGSRNDGPNLRAATFCSFVDGYGRVVSLLAWPQGVIFSTDNNTDAGPATTTFALDMSTIARRLSFATSANGVAFFIDDVLYALLPYGNSHPTIRNTLNFGNDFFYTGPGISEWQDVSFGRDWSITTSANQSVCLGASASFGVEVAGKSLPVLAYRWYRNGALIPSTGPNGNPSAATSNLQIATVSSADAGEYVCDVLSDCGVTRSAARTLQIESCCSPSDIAGPGQVPIPDGQLTADDIIVFINRFFQGC
jgi:hypothetical protein